MKINIVPTLISAGLGAVLSYLIYVIIGVDDIVNIVTLFIVNILFFITSFGVSYRTAGRSVNIRITTILFLIASLICNTAILNLGVSTEITQVSQVPQATLEL